LALTVSPVPISYELQVDDVGWDNFKQALLLIRNRITHPKTIEDLQLSDKEVQTAADAASWYLKVQRELIQKLMARMQLLQEKLDKK
jgi:hypothetical protein